MRREYVRDDFVIRLGRRDGRVHMRAGTRGTEASGPWLPEGPLPPEMELAARLTSWLELPSPELPEETILLKRVVLDIAEPELAGREWERDFARALSLDGIPVVRTSPVVPRVLSMPLTLPARLVHVDRKPPINVRQTVQDVFGERAPEDYADAVQVHEAEFEELGRLAWPTAEVVHFSAFFRFGSGDLLSTARPETPGTLGWLGRLTDIRQTRLVVLECRSPTEAFDARRLAAALVDRGGPAVLVGRTSHEFAILCRHFYAELIHDSPLDNNLGSWPPDRVSLFVGSGREEALRVSQIALDLLEVNRDLRRRKPTPASRGVTRLLGHTAADPKPAVARVRHRLDRMRKEMASGWQFQFHEGEGLLPMSRGLSDVRRIVGTRETAVYPEAPAEPPRPRYVNAGLFQEGDAGPVKLKPSRARVETGGRYQLGVGVGELDPDVHTIGATALLEKVFKWTPESNGVWLELGVTGLDFDVLGSPVQELWLPRNAPVDPIFFTVVPTVAGVARLRFTLYYGHNVIQSFLLGAITTRPGGKIAAPATRRRRLADALRVPQVAVKDDRYLVRLEYALVATPSESQTRPDRALSIVANHVGDRPVITVKGPDLFNVRSAETLPDYVDNVRDVLTAISRNPTPPARPEDWPYRFGTPGHPNRGDVTRLGDALRELARVGWHLFATIIPPGALPRLHEALEGERRVIHIAHTILEKAIPWAVLYDREYDAGKRKSEHGRAVAHAACLAALPGPNGELPVSSCGEHEDCLLHARKIAERREKGEPDLLPETVACPLHFWGFKHVLELPPQQVESNGDATPQRDHVNAGDKVQLAVAANGGLNLVGPHLRELKAAAARAKAPTRVREPRFDRDAVLAELEDHALDVVYFYCHAHGRNTPPRIWPPYLEFQTGTITHAQFAHRPPWAHHPLVFLNGCGTAGFTPDALSPFVTTLVDHRSAAGVVGTEVPIFEQLAGYMATRFLESFLNYRPAGEALLDARRALLAEMNPLGLIYTLYAAAHLKLRTDSQAGSAREAAPG